MIDVHPTIAHCIECALDGDAWLGDLDETLLYLGLLRLTKRIL